MTTKLKSKLNRENRVALQDVIPLASPFLLYVDPSSACNFKCQFCPTGHKDLVKESEYTRSTLNYEVFKKVIDDLGEFEKPLKVLRMNKIGEPTLNKNLAKMIAYAKQSGSVEAIDLATNAAILSRESMVELVEAGLNRLNISVEGVSREQYLERAKVDIDFEQFVEKIKWFYAHKRNCEITIKIPGNYLSGEQKNSFIDLFGNYCDRIFIEDLAPIWPSFDIENRAEIKLNENFGQYQQPLEQKEICTYIFYALAVNADGSVSACCPDWNQKLVVGDVKEETLKNIWNSDKLNALRLQHLEGKRSANITCRDCGHLRYAQVDNIDQFGNRLLEKFKNSQSGSEP